MCLHVIIIVVGEISLIGKPNYPGYVDARLFVTYYHFHQRIVAKVR